MRIFKFTIVALIVLMASCSRPIAKFSFDTEGMTAPTRIKFKNESENAESYFWNLGEGTETQEENPETQYLLSGNYEVSLIVNKGKKSNKLVKNIIVEAPEKCLVQLETPMGNMIIELYEDTPLHRENFTKLVEEGYYDDLLFHRVIENFMIQGGDPNSRNANERTRLGTGGPGYQVPAEFTDKYVHIKGALAAARQPDSVNPEKQSSGSQFYIVQGNEVTDASLNQVEYRTGIQYTEEQREMYKELGGYPFLDTQYTVFGRVIDGMEVIDKIAATPTHPGDRPVEDVSMKFKLIK